MELSWTSLATILIFAFLCQSSYSAGKNKKKGITKKCRTCRNFVEGFQEGITRTSRYNFGGGDVDWEEKKLGTYQTSETRFIEITDNICESSKHEVYIDRLYHVSKVNNGSPRFSAHLVATTNCCVNGTFGPECKECPGGVERPCRDNGECKGSGTRSGDGKCSCNDGYSGSLCDECKDSHFEESKNETHTVCRECHLSCSLKCTGPETKDCEECKEGWLWNDEHGCQDVDECAAEERPCNESQYCENNEGSYNCEACHASCDQCLGKGDEQCIKCRNGYNMEEGKCKDINECESDNHGCTGEHKICKNRPGTYQCDCEEGFELMGSECVDETKIYDEDNEEEPAENIGNEDQNEEVKEDKDKVNNNDTNEEEKTKQMEEVLSDNNDDGILTAGIENVDIQSSKTEL
ncbi:protein disulfide isomerase Creld2-like [Anneissia japonica]|uniref:protein disulfide isomerase Creld2-like n=1 Tax=Anneissia japonica TaxID=1529436 RepID=UPI001425BB3F|nr:protein disulfide isomerase Creld2-like [Anneissia japonica]